MCKADGFAVHPSPIMDDSTFMLTLRSKIFEQLSETGHAQDYFNCVLSVLRIMQRRATRCGNVVSLMDAYSIFIVERYYIEDVHFVMAHEFQF